jgi:hypothetical protein
MARRDGEHGIGRNDFGRIAQESDVLVNSVVAQCVKFAEARITKNLRCFIKHLAGNNKRVAGLEQQNEKLAGEARGKIVGAYQNRRVENDPSLMGPVVRPCLTHRFFENRAGVLLG